MGITPLSNLSPLPATRALERKLEPLPTERVENAPRSGDETYSGHNDDREDEIPDGAREPEPEPDPEPPTEPKESPATISFFA